MRVEHEWRKTAQAALQTFQTALALNHPRKESVRTKDVCFLAEGKILRRLAKLSWIMGNELEALRLFICSHRSARHSNVALVVSPEVMSQPFVVSSEVMSKTIFNESAHDASQPHEDGLSRMTQYRSILKVFAAAILLQYYASQQAPRAQPDADGAKEEQKQEEEEATRGVLISESLMFEFQQLEYLYGNCTWESVSTWTPANARERMLLEHESAGREEREIRRLKKLDLDDDEEEGDEDDPEQAETDTEAKQTHAMFWPKGAIYRGGFPKFIL